MTPDLALALVRRHYPEAETTHRATEAALAILQREYDLHPRQILLADSMCSDEINAIEYPPRALDMVGPFHMGGLNGFPHAGLTGMGAFAAHVPDNGAVMIYHAPHIGVSADGTLGMIHRHGQATPSGCCGAARAALAKLQAGQIHPGPPADLDYQQGVIEQIFLSNAARILQAPVPLREATEVMCEAIAARVELLTARTKFPARWLILYGAVLINGDPDMGSFSAARRLTIADLGSGETTDLMPLLGAT
jgi:Limiting CO2-inducible proteins B/C beta carbonyic anhydrases